jgi:hypothetical protein
VSLISCDPPDDEFTNKKRSTAALFGHGPHRPELGYKNKKALEAHNPEDFIVTNTTLCRLGIFIRYRGGPSNKDPIKTKLKLR